ncbi:polar amino acid transport system substrate-binding protein [Maridesulfovibrio ferrireducens]|uniref:Polar amino acid transport system substrate-binding protein n=2 Tax=Maridesulfovibrio ferrireducens TaxID=246191 RepID=A0A1G9LQM8_9BACT|nr:polar amino acid transport system substrate-binding protein [Maridesulfovibrio ferrireducens]
MTRLNNIALKSLFLLCMTFFLYAHTNACAQGVVTVGFASFPPWMILDEGKFEGFDCDLVRGVFKHMGLKVKFVSVSFDSSLDQLKSGEIDVLTSMLFRNERNDYIRYVSPPYKTKSIKSFYVKKGAENKINRYIDLVGLRVGVKKGAKYFPTFDLDDRVVRVFYGTTAEVFEGLVKGEVQVVISTDSVGNYFIKNMGLDSYVEECGFKYKPKLMPVYIGVSRKSPLAERADEIGAVIRYLQNSGEIERLAKKYSVKLN